MTTSHSLLKYAAFLSGGILLGYLLWGGLLTVQTSSQSEGSDSSITTAPGEDLRGKGGIDYEHAKPMPMPSLPDPVPGKTFPQPPSTGEKSDHPESVEGSVGTGRETPQILIPPKPPSEN